MNLLIFSRKENLQIGIKKIARIAKGHYRKCSILDIEHFESSRVLSRKTLIYFVTRNTKVASRIEAIKRVNQKGLRIINSSFITKDYSKYYIQDMLRKVGISTPQCWPCPTAKKMDSQIIRFPLYLKNCKHEKHYFYFTDQKQLKSKISRLKNLDQWYLESAVESAQMSLRKIYCIGKSVFDAQGEYAIPLWLKNVLIKISKTTCLDAFSADIFIDWKSREYSCIDINCVSTFFYSQAAQEKLVKTFFV